MKVIPKILGFLFFTCSLGKQATGQILADTTTVVVIDVDDPEEIPKDAKLQGKITVIGADLKVACGYNSIINQAKEKARNLGANLVNVTKLIDPDRLNACYRLHADAYYYPGITTYMEQRQRAADSIARSIFTDSPSYAMLYIYRTRNSMVPWINYVINVEDSEACTIKAGSAVAVKLFNSGPNKLWARTESETDLMINVVPGEVYFLQCGIKPGIAKGIPDLKLVETRKGLNQFNETLIGNHGKKKKFPKR